MSEEEADTLISNCEPYLRPIVVTALNTGMRKGEILSLTWDRVDLKNRIILLDKTKNGERREIPVNDTLYRALSGLTRRLDIKLVFPNPETLKQYYDLKGTFGRALAKSHITDFRFHDLRHTFASRLVMKGIDLTTVKELLGHKDVKMTLRYAHLAPAHIRKAVEILDDRCKIVAVECEGKTGKP
ncbi:MAG: site-specific integrase [bacterium]